MVDSMENKETETGQQPSERQPQRTLSEEVTVKELAQRENGRIPVQQQPPASKSSPSTLLAQLNWYVIVIFLEMITAVAVLTISDDSYPLVYMRYGLGLIFLFFLPGFTFTKVLFPTRNSAMSSEDMFSTGRIALSIGLSMVLTIIVGLALYYTPLGISLTSIVPVFIILTIVFVTIAVYRERRML